jgi:pimeloyl-ACP methyl ester carboxylesterase
MNTTRLSNYEEGLVDATGCPSLLLLHGWPYDTHSYVDIALALTKCGYRVIITYLRGNGSATFLQRDTSRSREQAAVVADIVELLDEIHILR